MEDLPNGVAKIQRLTRVAQAFTPSAPIDDLELFAGRLQQVQVVVNAVVQKGQHVALYGERGVGKTSLANILGDLFNAPDDRRFAWSRSTATHRKASIRSGERSIANCRSSPRAATADHGPMMCATTLSAWRLLHSSSLMSSTVSTMTRR